MTILTATELSALVTELLPVATIADLLELTPPDHQASIQVQGYYAAGDGGGGPPRYWSAASTATHNGGSVLRPDSAPAAGRWLASSAHQWTAKEFGAYNDDTNAATTLAAIIAAYAASKHVLFTAGTYNLGATSGSAALVSVDGGQSSIGLLTEGKVLFKCASAASSRGFFFKFKDAVGITIGSPHFQDTGFVAETTGAYGIYLEAASGEPTKGVTFDAIHGVNVAAPLLVAGTFANDRVSGISGGVINADTCDYGANFSNNGDDVEIDAIYTKSVSRSYFAYGVTRHTINIFSEASIASSADVMIQAGQLSGYDTSDLKIRYASRNTANTNALVSFMIFGENTKAIRNIDLNLDIVTSTAAKKVLFSAYNAAGTVENTGATNNIWDQFFIKGYVSGGAGETAIFSCQPTSKGYAEISSGLAGTIDSTMHQQFRLVGPLLQFTPRIDGLTAAGLGTYTEQVGRAQRVGNRMYIEIRLAWTAHTGTGNTSVAGLPLSSSVNTNPPLTVFASNFAWTAGNQLSAAVNASATTINLLQMDPAGGGAGLVPIDTAATLYLSGMYEVN